MQLNKQPRKCEGTEKGLNKAMRGYMEDWVGDSSMPKTIHGYFSGDSKPMYHIRFMNKLGKGSDSIHLKYNANDNEILMNKYYNLFTKLKK